MSVVHIFRHGTLGAPAISDTVGSAANLLKACLVDGYPLPGVVGITRSGGVATIEFTNNHGFFDTTYQIQVSGAAQPEYNGVFLASFFTANSLRYTVTGTPASPATGAITVRKTGAGWTTTIDNGHTVLFRNNPTTGSGNYFRVKDDGWIRTDQSVADFTHFTVTGAKNFATINDLVSPFPRTITGTDRHSNVHHGCPVIKSLNSAHRWTVVADNRTFYYLSETPIDFHMRTDTFGDIKLLANIVTHPRSIAAGNLTYTVADHSTWRGTYITGDSTAFQAPPRGFLEHPLTGGAQSTQFHTMPAVGTSSQGGKGIPNTNDSTRWPGYSHIYPSPITGGAVFEKIYICDDTNNPIRANRHTRWHTERFALVRGLDRCTHRLSSLLGDIGPRFSILKHGGRDYLLVDLFYNRSEVGAHAFDLTGPW